MKSDITSVGIHSVCFYIFLRLLFHLKEDVKELQIPWKRLLMLEIKHWSSKRHKKH